MKNTSLKDASLFLDDNEDQISEKADTVDNSDIRNSNKYLVESN